MKLLVAAFALGSMLCACAQDGDGGQARTPPSNASAAPQTAAQPPAPASAHAVVDADWGFRIDAPPGWTIRHDFAHGYLTSDAWKTYAPPDSRGVPIVALTLPGSNRITSAEIRIGASRDANETSGCATPADSVRTGSLHQERIDGADFTAFDASDAAMSHYLEVRSFRAVHDGACYAIDLLVYGTNPEVYDPPAKPPFSKEQAFARMAPVLRTFQFTR